MDKICYGKWTAWIAPVVMLLLSLFYVITAQPDFLSISCGAKTNHTADNNITWITDAHHIDVGRSEDDIGDVTEQAYGSYLHSFRYFPEPLNKSCYQLPVAPDVPYLLRLWFPPWMGTLQSYNFTFSIETVDMLAHRNVRLYQYKPIFHEFILVTKGRVLYICLVRSFVHAYGDPSISAIEMRRLQEGMYKNAQPGTILVTLSRYDVGGNSTVRYPQDKFDRIWRSDLEASSDLHNISSKEPISTNNANDLPPTAVLQTAWVVNNPGEITLISGALSAYADKTLVLLYFAEIERLNMSQSRSFSVSVNGVIQRETITLRQNYSAQEFTIHQDTAPNLVLDLFKSNDSTLPPIINAFECYGVHLSDQATYSEEFDALNAIKSRFDIKDWISPDPCYLVPWDGIGCENRRISELDLSGRNLTGAVPGDIAQLNSLVNIAQRYCTAELDPLFICV